MAQEGIVRVAVAGKKPRSEEPVLQVVIFGGSWVLRLARHSQPEKAVTFLIQRLGNTLITSDIPS